VNSRLTHAYVSGAALATACAALYRAMTATHVATTVSLLAPRKNTWARSGATITNVCMSCGTPRVAAAGLQLCAPHAVVPGGQGPASARASAYVANDAPTVNT